MSYLSLLLFLLMQTAKYPPVAGMPAAAGVYYRQAYAKWIKLEPAPMADMKTKGMGRFIETDGLSNLGMTVVFKGAAASMQISTPQPTFYVRGVGSAKDAIIIQLTRREDSRTIQASSSAASVGNKGGFKKEDIRRVTVIAYSDDSFSATPDEDLKAGEYLLAFAYATAGFDFGILAEAGGSRK
jgi:hypothetical protein